MKVLDRDGRVPQGSVLVVRYSRREQGACFGYRAFAEGERAIVNLMDYVVEVDLLGPCEALRFVSGGRAVLVTNTEGRPSFQGAGSADKAGKP